MTNVNNTQTVSTSITGLPEKGQRLGAMTIVSIQPFNSGQYSSDPRLTKLALDNMKLLLSGPIEVTGKYMFVHSEIGFYGYCMSDFDAVSLSRLPYHSLNGGVTGDFCFRNGNEARQKLGEKSRIVTVKIDNLEINSYPSEVTDYADLVNVIK